MLRSARNWARKSLKPFRGQNLPPVKFLKLLTCVKFKYFFSFSIFMSRIFQIGDIIQTGNIIRRIASKSRYGDFYLSIIKPDGREIENKTVSHTNEDLNELLKTCRKNDLHDTREKLSLAAN